MNTTMTVAYAKLPAEVMNNITLIGGWFVFVANMLALVHLVFLGASIAFDKVRDHPLAQITAGEWFTKIIFGVWVVAIAGNLAAAVLVFG
ncbi:hypothetical protein GR168_23650 (plasmid) [Gordonia sp. JH63]|uniref:hypothetical protein n=1 Tax=unclassified Gordonia (in: high G+C Gram-positive bacteria) TaxID=2657482 RepID=UPI00083AD4CF|nr:MULTISPECIES: hypothetical protein [unclassified Gordonia (in: high G+C Gram-positive bacteria)]OCW85991.1 hypothetical protein A8M60_03320 [Nocardia farcinica]QHD88477.1 hypothetical protein GR168_23650 [Gordonia sp. JH63]WGJ88124.1 hypothetical protein QAD21_23890 [Gordonia sp. SMJS1]